MLRQIAPVFFTMDIPATKRRKFISALTRWANLYRASGA